MSERAGLWIVCKAEDAAYFEKHLGQDEGRGEAEADGSRSLWFTEVPWGGVDYIQQAARDGVDCVAQHEAHVEWNPCAMISYQGAFVSQECGLEGHHRLVVSVLNPDSFRAAREFFELWEFVIVKLRGRG